MMENYLLRQLTELGIKTDQTDTNSIYEFMQERPRHTVRVKESDFRASDVSMIKAGQRKMRRRP